jgi:cellulose synthase/poly-beta-1,6-N-acetylglucosamine synthase-like glycosyltransferase
MKAAKDTPKASAPRGPAAGEAPCPPQTAGPVLHSGRKLPRIPWWGLAGLILAAWAALLCATLAGGGAFPTVVSSPGWWCVTIALHLPYLLILLFLACGIVERIGFFWKGRATEVAGRLPATLPTVCVQLPMFNEHAVARRSIEAAAALQWPKDRLTVQVLDDSTDPLVREMVREVCARVREETGVNCSLIHRTDRKGYKAGALEVGRRQTDAEFLAIFDADFLPPSDYLMRAVPYFYAPDGTPDSRLALVQAQWGHLNDDESFLTQAQALWVDDHHTLQKSWRSAAVGFVNFTGTAGVWRASAIEAVGGWRSTSLVEDCELSFRILFAGYRTRFVKEIVVPAELPATYAAYRLQQRRWTQGWVQLQRLHLGNLLFRYRTSLLRRIYLTYHMCISWQWPAWALWITLLPFLIANDHWLGAFGPGIGFFVYAGPPLAYVLFAAAVATLQSKFKYFHQPGPAVRGFFRRLARIVPYIVVNAGMFPHQLSAFMEGLFGPMHCEFERTPKAATVIAAGPNPVRREARSPKRAGGLQIRGPYLATEAAYVFSQLAWFVIFLADGLLLAALGAGWLAACVAGIGVASYLPNLFTRRTPLAQTSPEPA